MMEASTVKLMLYWNYEESHWMVAQNVP